MRSRYNKGDDRSDGTDDSMCTSDEMRSWRRLLALIGVAAALPSTAGAGGNIALHRPYTWSRAPNYAPCQDDGDSKQLTDGQLTAADRGFWIQKPAVGWQRLWGPLSITIDLGSVRAIGAISFRSAGGGSAVAFPAFIHVWMSDDGTSYHFEGELIALSWQQGLPDSAGDPRAPRGWPAGVHRYLAEDLRLGGRFVKLIVWPAGSYLFCDEIEVFEGGFDARDAARAGPSLNGDFDEWVRRHRHHAIAQVRMIYDLQELGRHPEAGNFTDDIDRLRARVLSMPCIEALDMTRGLPYTPLHARIWALHGRMQRSGGHPAFQCWPAAPYRSLHPFDVAPDTPSSPVVHLLGNEARPVAVNVSSNGTETVRATVSLRWTGRPWPQDAIELATVRFTETQERAIWSGALVDVAPARPDRWEIELQGGITTQLWLTLHSRDLPRGRYDGTFVMDVGEVGSPLEFPLAIHVHAGRAPAMPSLDAYTWDYLHVPGRRLITDRNRSEALALLRRYGVRSYWIDLWHLPFGTDMATDGSYARLANLDRFDAQLDFIGPARRYYLYVSLGKARKEFRGREPFTGGHVPGTPQFDNAARSYFRLLSDHLDARGLDKTRFVFCVLDEPTGKGPGERLAAQFMRIGKDTEPAFLFFENPVARSADDLYRPLLEASDVLCPKFTTGDDAAYATYLRTLVRPGVTELHGYDCTDGGWWRSPTGYFRRMAWKAWQFDMRGVGVWSSMAANVPGNWDDFRGGPAWEMLLATPERVTPTKLLAAWRDGIADYEYFRILRDLVRRGEAAKLREGRLEAARDLLEDLAPAAIRRTSPRERNVGHDSFDQARLRLLIAIDGLTDAIGR
ncbi:MAG: hypothetical protein CMJ18_23875 [Phycisphaeraceae bacterium]|nr:hypothetical protein [Phycisphaeraceae bacterium]